MAPQRLSKNIVMILLGLSMLANAMLLLQLTGATGGSSGGLGSGSELLANGNNNNAAAECPPCKCDCATAVKSENKNEKTLASSDDSILPRKAAEAVGGAVAPVDGDADVLGSGNAAAPASYVKHGAISKYDHSSPIHTIVEVSGVGPMVAIATPIWRLISKDIRVGNKADDDLPAPGQVVGSEKLNNDEAANTVAPTADFNKPDNEVEKDDTNNNNKGGDASSARKLLAEASVDGSSLANSRIPPAESLQLWAPKDVTRISIDVGTFLTSPSSKRWWYWDPKVMVFAFEPNIVSGMLLTRISHPAFNTQLSGYWPSCPLTVAQPDGSYSSTGPSGKPIINRQVQLDNLSDCLNKSYGHITSHMDRFVLFPVALSNKDYFASFQYGFPGRADSGSLLSFSRSMIKKRQGAKPLFALPTPVMKMASILTLLPTHRRTDGSPILWDTLKIDAQGVDSLIIEGAGHLLRRFACILGEFDYSSYKGVRKFDYRAYLVYELGFIMLKKTTFINPALADVVHSQQALCFSSDVAVEYGKLGKVIAKMRADGTYPKQREHPELAPIRRG